jgi:hypothetical protein
MVWHMIVMRMICGAAGGDKFTGKLGVETPRGMRASQTLDLFPAAPGRLAMTKEVE